MHLYYYLWNYPLFLIGYRAIIGNWINDNVHLVNWLNQQIMNKLQATEKFIQLVNLKVKFDKLSIAIRI